MEILETSLNTGKRNYILKKSLFNKTKTLFNLNREIIRYLKHVLLINEQVYYLVD